MTQKALIALGLASAMTLALGLGIGHYSGSGAVEEARVAALSERDRSTALAAQLEDARARAAALESERQAAVDGRDRLAARLQELETELASARAKDATAAEAAAAAARKRLPVAFGSHQGLEGLVNADWNEMGEAVSAMYELFLDYMEKEKNGETPDADFQKKVQAENTKLVKLAAGVMGKLPTHSPINGEFTHPLVLSNLMASVLERAELPLSDEQQESIAELGAEYEKAYEAAQSEYDDSTPLLTKMIDELELKHDTMERMHQALSREQRGLVIQPEIHDRAPFDVLSPVVSTLMLAEPKQAASVEDFRKTFQSGFAKTYDLSEAQLAALQGPLETCFEEMQPILEPNAGGAPPTLGQYIVAGSAQAKLRQALMRLPDLAEKAKATAIGHPGWIVPQIVPKKD